MTKMLIIIPAFNEEKYIATTLNHLFRAVQHLREEGFPPPETLVVDNGSTDKTPLIVRSSCVVVLDETIHNVAAVRNTGASSATGEILVFIDADTLVPETLLSRIAQVMSDPACLGGAVDTEHRPTRFSAKAYLRLWRLVGQLAGMAQGAVQFCRRDAYLTLGGYDESIYMGEDVDFYWRLRRSARERGMRVCYLQDIKAIPSC